MKIAICCNHSFPHVGGSEVVVQKMAEAMHELYGHECIVISRSIYKSITHNGISYINCPSEPISFMGLLNKIDADHLLIYSDCFLFWPQIIRNIDTIQSKVTLVPVGMNHMLSNRKDLTAFVKKSNRFGIITHSDNYKDYQWCRDNRVDATVIPNGVDLEEFESNKIDFRDKYNIETDNIILCVSNFFPGKGQEYLVQVLDMLSKKRNDFTAIFVSTTVNFPFARILSQRIESHLHNAQYKSRFLVDIPREDVISAFIAADVFAFPSQKEVAPLVLLEAMASKTPWVAMPVGNSQQLAGGMTVPVRSADSNGYFKYTGESYSTFCHHLNQILEDPSLKQELGLAGFRQVQDKYNWDQIAQQYHDFFEKR